MVPTLNPKTTKDEKIKDGKKTETLRKNSRGETPDGKGQGT